MELTDNDIKQLNAFENFLSFQTTWAYSKFIHCKHKTIALLTGNQYGKTAGVAHQYVLRILGQHPVPEKNVLYFECDSRYCKNGHKHTEIPKDGICTECDAKISKFGKHTYSIKTKPKDNICTDCGGNIRIHERKTTAFRFCSQVQPNDKGDTGDGSTSTETKNTVYPEFKKWLPPFLIKKDITARNAAMLIKNPNAGQVFDGLEYKGNDILVDFVSYSQEDQGTAGVQRLSIWCDEEPGESFYNEQIPRLMSENGDFILSLTPANFITWTYDSLFEKSKIYYRTKAICDFLGKQGQRVKQIEETDSPLDIAVIQAASDDNPTLDEEAIEEKLQRFDDPDVIAIRRYGIFKQVSGRILKDFEYSTHFIDSDKYFPDGIPRETYVHARGIDYHSQTPWASSSMSISPQNEAFIWCEFNPSPEKMTVKEISREIALMGKDYKYTLNLVDPFIKTTSKDGVTSLDDLNREFYELKRENIGEGGYWQGWDTKGEKGRDEIRQRLKNASKVGKPFNNKVVENGRTQYLPTLWVLNSCKLTGQSMRRWRWGEWANSRDRTSKDAKNKPMQKWSHFCMVIEAIFKEPAFKARDSTYRPPPPKQYNYFQGRGR